MTRLVNPEAPPAEQLSAVMSLLDTFVSILGHDIRNPLCAITAAANLLEARADSERITKPVGRIVTSADRMDRMITQLLDFMKIRLGRGLVLDRRGVDLGQLTRATIDELMPPHDRDIQIDAQGDLVGTWDGDRLTQLIANLVANACVHGAQATRVVVALDGSSAERVRLEVRNRGVIPAELAAVIFEPHRPAREGADGDRREKRHGASGLGLGLYITQQIALAHAGTIRVDSDEARGTRFIVELPRALAERPA